MKSILEQGNGDDCMGFPGDSVVKNPPANSGDAEDMGLIPGSGISPGKGSGHPLQYSCLDNPIKRGVWQATVQSQKQLNMTEHTHTVAVA